MVAVGKNGPVAGVFAGASQASCWRIDLKLGPGLGPELRPGSSVGLPHSFQPVAVHAEIPIVAWPYIPEDLAMPRFPSRRVESNPNSNACECD